MNDEARPEQQSCGGRAPILTTHGLTKQFTELRAVDGLDIEVCRGDIFGFLGPNGAGKTTIIRIVVGLIRATGRSILLRRAFLSQHEWKR